MLLEYIYQYSGKYLFYSRLFSTSFATVFSFLVAIIIFKPYINLLRRINFSSELENSRGIKHPVMPAGILFLFIIFITCIISVRFNSYVISALIIYIFFSCIGAIDDVAKVINKRRFVRGEITKEDYQYKADGISAALRLVLYLIISLAVAIAAYKYIPNINGHITIPFLSITRKFPYLPFWFFIPFMTMAIFVMANGVNFTDGLDTLSTVPLITCASFVGIISYISSNSVWSNYLLIPYIPGVEELLPLIGAVIGTLLAFLWYNSPPSSIIMGDSGSIGLGGLIGIMFIFIKAGFYLPILGFIFLLEFSSSLLQIGYFKLTHKRIFLRAPIHHHFQFLMRKSGKYSNEKNINSKITWRFHIISIVLFIVGTILFLKVR
ncbi:MAG: phospho-N-acetylmuramoyl-pentapeptide-transferase [Chitinispirillia bacterium]|jgi:phospho-N-acetylmuramoyl-pentapeptide-transferase